MLQQMFDLSQCFWATVCKTVRPMLLKRCLVCLSVLSVTLVYCGQTAGYQDATWYGGVPWHRRHSVMWEPSSPRKAAQPLMSIYVAKRSPISATAELLLCVVNARGTVPCFAGFYNEVHGSDTCLPCPQGSYQEEPAGTKCFVCPPGKTTNTTGAVSVDQCTDNVPVSESEYQPSAYHFY